MRVSPAGRADHDKTRREFEVLRVAFARGVRCPEPIAIGVVRIAARTTCVMSRMPGDTNPRQLITNDTLSPRCTRRCITQLAEDLARHPSDHAGRRAGRARTCAAQRRARTRSRWHRQACEQMYRNDLLNPHPAIEWAFRWLDGQIATLGADRAPPCVVHGDFRIGNMLYDERGLTSILDWEGVHVGEPEEDIAWLCTRVWRFGSNASRRAASRSREDWLAAYEKASRPQHRPRRAWRRGRCCRTSAGARSR